MKISFVRCVVIGAFALAPAAHAQVYKWVDERGTTNYGNKPPTARQVTRLTDAESTLSIIPSPRPQPAVPAREREARALEARARDALPVAFDRPVPAAAREPEWRERCFAERRVDCSAPTAATYDITLSFAPFPYSPLR